MSARAAERRGMAALPVNGLANIGDPIPTYAGFGRRDVSVSSQLTVEP